MAGGQLNCVLNYVSPGLSFHSLLLFSGTIQPFLHIILLEFLGSFMKEQFDVWSFQSNIKFL